MNIKITYSKISIYSCILALLFYFLVLAELPRNDDIDGHFISFLYSFAVPPEPGQEIHMKSSSFWSISEAKIISSLYLLFITASVISIVTGLFAFFRNEPTRKQAGAIAISFLLIIYAYQLSWVFRWH